MVRNHTLGESRAMRRAYRDTGQQGVLAELPTLPVPGYVMGRSRHWHGVRGDSAAR